MEKLDDFSMAHKNVPAADQMEQEVEVNDPRPLESELLDADQTEQTIEVSESRKRLPPRPLQEIDAQTYIYRGTTVPLVGRKHRDKFGMLFQLHPTGLLAKYSEQTDAAKEKLPTQT